MKEEILLITVNVPIAVSLVAVRYKCLNKLFVWCEKHEMRCFKDKCNIQNVIWILTDQDDFNADAYTRK